MSFVSLLLRLLLGAALILEGSGASFAATKMQMGHAAAVMHGAGTDSPAMQGDTGACHGMADMPSHSPAVPDDDGDGDHGQPDCCQSDRCDCVCAQSLPTLVSCGWLRPAVPFHPPLNVTTATGHPAPPLPHPQRPPIA